MTKGETPAEVDPLRRERLLEKGGEEKLEVTQTSEPRTQHFCLKREGEIGGSLYFYWGQNRSDYDLWGTGFQKKEREQGGFHHPPIGRAPGRTFAERTGSTFLS